MKTAKNPWKVRHFSAAGDAEYRRMNLETRKRYPAEYALFQKTMFDIISGLAPLYKYIDEIEFNESAFPHDYDFDIKISHPKIRASNSEYIAIRVSRDNQDMDEMRVFGRLKLVEKWEDL